MFLVQKVLLRLGSPKLGDLGLKLLLTGQVLILTGGDTVNAAGSALVDGKFLLVALELPRELLDALFKMCLAGLRCDEGLASLAKFLDLEPNVNVDVNRHSSRTMYLRPSRSCPAVP